MDDEQKLDDHAFNICSIANQKLTAFLRIKIFVFWKNDAIFLKPSKNLNSDIAR